ncbi:MAG: Ig-like domain-containing protein [Rikenellaceae bacterium]|nr:Ig-like domain-containing protein [Rikenellaceae bacterium]
MEYLSRFVVKYIVNGLVVTFFVAGLLWRCGHAAIPQGGPRDTLPPVVVNMTPYFGTTNFDEKRIYIEFDEYVQLKNQQAEFFTSPRMAKKPTVLIRGRGIQIDIQDTLKENTTYALNFGSAIADNNEGNPLNGFRYVFSTGDELDSMIMSGYTVDAYKKDSVSKAFIFFYAAEKDSIALDSTVFNHEPDVIARSENNGIFVAENLKPIDYRVYAILDNNGNQTYDPGVDDVAFLDSIYNPATMPGFNVWYDTTRSYVTADPQLYFRLFLDDAFKRQYLSSQSRPQQHKVVLTFGAPYPQIDTLRFDGIDPAAIITEYLKPTRDSIALWFDLPSDLLPDTLKGRLSYLRHDSINRLEPYGQDLRLGWKAFESREEERERLAREKEREKAIAEGREPEKEPNPFRVSVEAANPLNPENNIALTFDYPLVSLDTARISLIRTEEENRYRVRYTLEQDTMNIRRYTLRAPWADGQDYELTIPEGTFVNIAGESNDTLRSTFTVMDRDKYATLVINLKGKTPDSEYVLELLDQSGGRIIREVTHATTGRYVFRYLDAGAVRLRIVEDMNRNGMWDKGDLVNRIQPERVEMFLLGNGDEEIPTKMGWEDEYTVDCEVIFAPVTMRSVMEQLRRQEEARMRRWFEELEKKQNEDERRGGGRNTQSNTFNPTGGFNIR